MYTAADTAVDAAADATTSNYHYHCYTTNIITITH